MDASTSRRDRDVLASSTRNLHRLQLLSRSAALRSVALALTIGLPSFPTSATEHDPALFGQLGRGDVAVTSATIGVTASLLTDAYRNDRPWDVVGELSLGRWNVHPDQQHQRHIDQLGLTPVVRYTFAPSVGGIFVELGVGVNAITPIFMSRNRSFSTTFNFGDHLGIGKRFGKSREHEVALHIQHYSNAGIKHPNPGEDFVQLRYGYHF